MNDEMEARFLKYVEPIPEGLGCWEWIGAQVRGYGYFWYKPEGPRTRRACRVAYEHYVGDIPKGLTIDHLCRNKSCVNPAHLEAVSHRVNVLRSDNPAAVNARKTHCLRGHEYDKQATSQRYCTKCRTLCERKRRASKRGKNV